MSNDLVKRLRMVTGFIRFETGDRIAASACLSEEAADRIEELETKLAKAVEALIELADVADDNLEEKVSARTTLAAVSETHKLKGEKDND